MSHKALTPKQKLFADAYLADRSLNATAAYKAAGYAAKNDNVAAVEASKLLSNPKIVAYVASRQQERIERIELKQDDVLRVLLNMMAADANELVEYRRHCCRFCWGVDNKYQRTASEMDADRANYEQQVLKQQADPQMAGKPVQPFNEAGGIGYDERKGPNKDCGECFGDGVGKTIIKDTRTLSPAARALYAGVKQTKEGIEVKMQAKDTHLQLLMRHMGMLNDKVKLQGDPENPLTVLMQQLAGKTFKPVD